ncbi:hypothetical protein D3C83_26450 [compost metagenome]
MSATQAPSNEPTTTPASTSTSSGSWPRTAFAVMYTNPTATRPKANAKPWIAITFNERKMPSTAPTAAPADTPRMSGETRGLRNMF